jgi:hypothetical protein
VLALKHGLPRASHLAHLVLRGLAFSPDDVTILSKTLRKCHCHALTFDHIPIKDDGFATLSSSLRLCPLSVLSLISCDLSDASAGGLKSVLLRDDVRARGRKKKAQCALRELRLPGNAFSYRLILDLGEALSAPPLALLDLRDNQAIDSRIIGNIRKVVKRLEIRVTPRK